MIFIKIFKINAKYILKKCYNKQALKGTLNFNINMLTIF